MPSLPASRTIPSTFPAPRAPKHPSAARKYGSFPSWPRQNPDARLGGLRDHYRMNRERLQHAWWYHGYLAAALLFIALAAALAGAFDLAGRLSEWIGISAATLGILLLPLATALAFVSLHAVRERRRRMRYEWNLVRTNLSLRQAAASMERLARIDALTGLDNRRAWNEKLEQEWRRAERYGSPPAVIMLDLDHFKEVNDRHGHAVGDELLVAVADVLRRSLRTSDAVARLGGDEFAVLLPQASKEEAMLVAEKMRHQVALTLSQHTPDVPVTASAGVATGDALQRNGVAQLLRAADRAMYDAKAAGRNCVVVAADPESPQLRATA